MSDFNKEDTVFSENITPSSSDGSSPEVEPPTLIDTFEKASVTVCEQLWEDSKLIRTLASKTTDLDMVVILHDLADNTVDIGDYLYQAAGRSAHAKRFTDQPFQIETLEEYLTNARLRRAT